MVGIQLDCRHNISFISLNEQQVFLQLPNTLGQTILNVHEIGFNCNHQFFPQSIPEYFYGPATVPPRPKPVVVRDWQAFSGKIFAL